MSIQRKVWSYLNFSAGGMGSSISTLEQYVVIKGNIEMRPEKLRELHFWIGLCGR